ncbi:MAG TPA: hypothetical protein DEB31_08290 [Clostridiales bacterium]|nr:hypothetical protein [Clostridiales bacterium]
MSNVLMRKRSISGLEFWKNGADIRAHLTRFLMNEKNVPKRYTYVFTFPGIDLGRIVARPCRECVTRQRRKMKKFRKFLDAGDMTLEQIHTSYMSWRGYIAHKNARRTIHNMDHFYEKLFGCWPMKGEQRHGQAKARSAY